jgi:hypothetical protein
VVAKFLCEERSFTAAPKMSEKKKKSKSKSKSKTNIIEPSEDGHSSAGTSLLGGLVERVATGLIGSLSDGFTEIVDGCSQIGDGIYNNFPSPPLSLSFSGEDTNPGDRAFKGLQSESSRSIEIMERTPCFLGIPQLFSELFAILDVFLVNQVAAKQFYKRLCHFTIVLAHPTQKSVHNQADRLKNQRSAAALSITVLEPLANILSRAVRYFFRFTTDIAYIEILSSRCELSNRFVEFDTQLCICLSGLIRIFDCRRPDDDTTDEQEVIALDIKTPAYDVVDNLRDLTKEANAHHGEAFSLIEKFRIPETQKGKNSIVLLY